MNEKLRAFAASIGSRKRTWEAEKAVIGRQRQFSSKGQSMTPHDSLGNPLVVGDKVTFRGCVYVIKEFLRDGSARVEFVEVHRAGSMSDTTIPQLPAGWWTS